MTPEIEVSANASESRSLENRLHVSHVLLWISATAVVLAGVRPAFEQVTLNEQATAQTRQFYQQRHRTALVFLPTIAPIWGLGLAGIVLAGWRLFRAGPSFPVQPGHWLLLIQGSFVVAILTILLAMRFDHHRGIRNLMIFLGWSGVAILPFAALALAAFKSRGPDYWLVSFRGLAACIGLIFLGSLWSQWAFHYAKSVEAIGMIPAFFGFGLSVLFIVILAGSPLFDLLSRAKLDILHWVGASLIPLHFLWLIGCFVALAVWH